MRYLHVSTSKPDPDAPLHVLFVRHGETDSNAQGILQGHLPIPLNALGYQQAARLAARLASFDPAIDALVTSDLRRAIETAAPIARALALDLVTDAAWRERGFGTFEGRTVGDTEIWRAATGTIDPPGAEPIPEMEVRVSEAFTRLVARWRDRRSVAVVTHGGVIRTLLHLLASGRVPLDGSLPVVGPVPNASILQLLVDPATLGCTIVRLNDVAHLAVETVTTRDAG